MMLLIWLLTLVATLWLYFRQVYSRYCNFGIKYLTPLPFFGNMARVTFRREHITEYNNRVFSKFHGERFCGTYEFLSPLVMIRDLALIKQVTVKDCEYFLDRRGMIDEKIEPLFGSNLFSLKGQKWKDMRSTLSPAFTSSKIRLMVLLMEESAAQMIDALKQKIKSKGVDYIDVDCKDLLTRYSNDVTAACAFGLKVNSHLEQNDEFFEMSQTAANISFYQFLKFVGYRAFPNVMQILKVQMFPETSKKFYRSLVKSAMETREKKNISRNDMINLLIEAKKGKLCYDLSITNDADVGFATVQESDVGKKKVSREWSDDDLLAQAVFFFIAGVEISAFMTFLLFELAANPDVQEKLVREIEQHHERNHGILDYTSLQNLMYLDMVVSELLRKWSPTFSERICKKTYNLGKPNKDATEDYIIREGEGIVVPIWSIHHSPEYYPEPNKFDPERFSEENKHNIKPLSYLPFGIGPRNCIGSRFALCEMKVMTYWLLLSMEVLPCEKTRLPIQLSTESFNLRIKGGHWLRIKTRH